MFAISAFLTGLGIGLNGGNQFDEIPNIVSVGLLVGGIAVLGIGNTFNKKSK